MDHTKIVVFLFFALGIVASVTSIKKFHPKLSRDAKVKVSLFILCFSCNFSLTHQKIRHLQGPRYTFLAHFPAASRGLSRQEEKKRKERERPLPASDAFCITLQLFIPRERPLLAGSALLKITINDKSFRLFGCFNVLL